MNNYYDLKQIKRINVVKVKLSPRDSGKNYIKQKGGRKR